MSPASPSLPSTDSQLNWRKRKRDRNPKRQQKPHEEDEEEDEDADAVAAGDEDAEGDKDYRADRNTGSAFDLRHTEVLSDGGQRICDFPVVIRRTVNRPHVSVISIVVAERLQLSGASSWGGSANLPFLENISHGQLQALSSVLPDHTSLHPPDFDKHSTYVCTSPVLMEGKGIMKRFGNDQVLIVPMHSDWFSSTNVHRLERQVIPHFFNGRSTEHTPEKYTALRNKIIAKYMESPARRLSFADCQGLVADSELYDLSRIVRFLDHWGIINYLSASSVHRGLRMAGSLLREDASGELSVQTKPLRSIDSLILFDRPKCSLKLDDMAFLPTSSSSVDSVSCLGDLDVRIREKLSEHACSYCSKPLPNLFYQSQKEAETVLCSECFSDAKFITGHSSLDFVRMDSKKDFTDVDGDSWTDQETLLLLEAIEKYNDNWNEIAKHVGTKSKAQCILHFIGLPIEDGLLENIDVPRVDASAVSSEMQNNGFSWSNSQSNAATSELDSGDQLPFISSANPVMSLVAFLASAIAPRVAASCASAALSVLTKEDFRLNPENVHDVVGSQGASYTNSSNQKDNYTEDQASNLSRDSNSLSSEHVRYAALCGLSAAATKTKLFADQEEREVQRLAANIISHQVYLLGNIKETGAEAKTICRGGNIFIERN
ncbi:SWI/SNF complex subunit SWI3C isoform X2 [Phalaenopsis equestris]|uniref:SWI/SNF complex subunit SWI3C isoform X2 n=1 Tax=Phalaenopsis equestris TaxID=78828 RepID=UPI0009E2F5F1|nr:SWI/SNF complex subunit SWI3C isoform X2 [Phalaenopsis equestris]